jgi:hypothetical protein
MNTFGILSFFFVSIIVHCDDRVKVNVYYESLCPQTSEFFNKQLSEAYNQIFNIMDLKLIPFGKANVNLFFTF